MARKFLTPPQVSKIIFNQAPDTGMQQGELLYDQQHLGLMFGLSASTQLELGQQNAILSYNNSGSPIPAGRAVYGIGVENERPSVVMSTSATSQEAKRTFGVTMEAIPNGGSGWVATSGLLQGINTAAYAAGDELWLSSASPGIFVTSKTGFPNHDLLVGYCVVSASVGGSIYLTFDRGVDTEDIHDFNLTNTQNNQLLVYNSASVSWDNKYINAVPFDDIPYIDFSTASTVPVSDVAKMVWDDGEGTLTFGLKGGNVDLNIGTEQVALCYNGTAGTLVDGQAVYISGAQGQRPRIGLAQANTESSSSKVLGIVTEPITSGAEGFVTTFGIVNGLNTSSYTAGDALWLSPTVAGGITNVKPTAPNHLVFIGYVISVSTNAGRIFVKPQNGYELDELHDVLITAKADNHILSYNGSASVWQNQGLNAAILEVDGAGSNIDADFLDGQHGAYYLDWTNTTNKPDLAITLGGDLSGSATFTDLANGTLTATINANSVALGTDTTGNYVAQVTGTTDQVNVSGSGSESASVVLSLPQSIATSSSPTFSSLTTTSKLITAPSTSALASINIPHGASPTSPVDGDIWSTASGFYIRVNGATIGPLGTGGGGGGATVTVSTTAPAGPTTGALWYETDTNIFWVWDGSQWDAIGGQASTLAQAYISASVPSSASVGTLWIDENTLDIYTFYDSTWVQVAANDGVPAIVSSGSPTLPQNGVLWLDSDDDKFYVYRTGEWLEITGGTGGGSGSTVYAPLNSPAFTGIPTAITASVDTNTTQLATTAFVINQGYLKEVSASTIYLDFVSASNTYLTQSAASATYLTQSAASTTYLTSSTGVTTVNGSSGAISNVALTTNGLGQFASTTSSQLNTVISDNTGSGSVVFSDSPTITGTAFFTGNAPALELTGAPSATATTNGLLDVGLLSFSDTNIIAGFAHDVNSYAQVILQNKNAGTLASADFIVNNNTGSASANYGDFGINSSGYTGTSPWNDPSGTYLYSNGGTLTIGTQGTQNLRFVVNNAIQTIINQSGNVSASTFTSTIPTGTAPFSVTSTTVVTNLNADLLDGQTGAYYTEEIIPFSKTGAIASSTTGTLRFRFPFAATIQGISAILGTAGTGNTTINVVKNGTTNINASVVTLTSGVAAEVTSFTAGADSMVIGDYMTVNIATAGTGAADLSVFIRYRRT